MIEPEQPRRRRWPRVLAALLGLILIGAFAGALVSRRYVEGSVPGEDPILGLAAIEAGFVVGTSKGMYVSDDGVTWSRPQESTSGRTLVTSDATRAIAMSEGVIVATDNLSDFLPAVGSIQEGIAISADADGNIYVAESPDAFVLFSANGGLARATPESGPNEIVAIDALAGQPVTLFAGGLTSGFWISRSGGARWRHVLKTPVRTIVVDPEDPKRVFIGTAGGVLVSKDGGLRWGFTSMKSRTEALAFGRGRLFALTEERTLYSSKDGLEGWERVDPSG